MLTHLDPTLVTFGTFAKTHLHNAEIEKHIVILCDADLDNLNFLSDCPEAWIWCWAKITWNHKSIQQSNYQMVPLALLRKDSYFIQCDHWSTDLSRSPSSQLSAPLPGPLLPNTHRPRSHDQQCGYSPEIWFTFIQQGADMSNYKSV